MLRLRIALGVAALCAVEAMGCTIITTDNGNPNPPPRPRPRRPQTGNPARPPAPRKPAPAPAQTNTKVTPGLHGTNPELPPQPAKTDPPATPTRPTVMASGVAAGRPRGFIPGAGAAFWIWQGPRGGWRIRTTTKNVEHVFRGRVLPIDTHINAVSPSRTELRDRIWKNGNSWLFSFKTAGHADGFTFKTKDNGCVKFDLQLDGGPVPKRIVIGKNQVSPATNHFILCPHGKKP